MTATIAKYSEIQKCLYVYGKPYKQIAILYEYSDRKGATMHTVGDKETVREVYDSVDKSLYVGSDTTLIFIVYENDVDNSDLFNAILSSDSLLTQYHKKIEGSLNMNIESTILPEMKKDRMAAMKARDSFTKDTLTTLIGDLDADLHRGAVLNDVTCTNKLIKAVKTAKDNFELTKDNIFLAEVRVYEKYLPKPLTDTEIMDIVKAFVSDNSGANVGTVMNYMKQNYQGRYDGQFTSKFVKDFILRV